MADEHKGIALVILGIVAILAIVGLVLLFTNRTATGNGIYGGAIKQIEYPNWVGRGIPRGGIADSSSTYTPGETASNDLHTHWNWEGNPKRTPPTGGEAGDIPSPMIKCGQNCFLTSINPEQAGYYASLGYNVINAVGPKAGVCVCPGEPMVGGIAGYTEASYGNIYGGNYG
jgi:hypothetical protein